MAADVKVFISYAREDYETAKKLIDDLKPISAMATEARFFRTTATSCFQFVGQLILWFFKRREDRDSIPLL